MPDGARRATLSYASSTTRWREHVRRLPGYDDPDLRLCDQLRSRAIRVRAPGVRSLPCRGTSVPRAPSIGDRPYPRPSSSMGVVPRSRSRTTSDPGGPQSASLRADVNSTCHEMAARLQMAVACDLPSVPGTETGFPARRALAFPAIASTTPFLGPSHSLSPCSLLTATKYETQVGVSLCHLHVNIVILV